MKKFIFSAVAMMAFVGSSVANDIAEVRSSVGYSKGETSSENQNTQMLLRMTKCDIIWFTTYVNAMEQFNNNKDIATSIALGAFQACVEVTEGDGGNQPAQPPVQSEIKP